MLCIAKSFLDADQVHWNELRVLTGLGYKGQISSHFSSTAALSLEAQRKVMYTQSACISHSRSGGA